MTAVQTQRGQHRVGAAGPVARTAALLRWPVTAAAMVLAVLTLSWRALPEISPAGPLAFALRLLDVRFRTPGIVPGRCFSSAVS